MRPLRLVETDVTATDPQRRRYRFVNPQCGRVHRCVLTQTGLRSSRVRRHGEPSSGVHESAPGGRGVSGRHLVDGRRAPRLAARLRRLLPGVGAGRPRRLSRRRPGPTWRRCGSRSGTSPWRPAAAHRGLPTQEMSVARHPLRSSGTVRRRGPRGHGEPAEGARAVRRPGPSRPRADDARPTRLRSSRPWAGGARRRRGELAGGRPSARCPRPARPRPSDVAAHPDGAPAVDPSPGRGRPATAPPAARGRHGSAWHRARPRGCRSPRGIAAAEAGRRCGRLDRPRGRSRANSSPARCG